MLDIKFIKENKDIVKAAAEKKHIKIDIDHLIEIDDKRRKMITQFEKDKAEQNIASDQIARITDESERKHLITKTKMLKEVVAISEAELKEIIKEWQYLMVRVPNIPDMSVPEGETDADNKEIKRWGEIREFDFEPKNHIELMQNLDMVDFERGSKIHGFRGYFLKNDGALLSWAVWNYAQEFFLKKNFEPFIAPSIVKKDFFYGTGHLPNDAEDLFKTQDEDYLSGTAEVPMMAYHSDEIFKKEDLPKRYLAFSPCFRREAGSYGKDTKGLFRVNEFFKFEQLILCEASHEKSVEFHEEITKNIEEFMESLGLPYRRLAICAGDLKASQVKSYDTDLWIPSEKKYREIGSASYYHDFQTRRFNTRYDDNGKKLYVYSLNCTAVPTPRALIALVENNQNKDGSINIPEALKKYIGKDIIKK
ncbi:serine--tRNA ligase [Candidatus Campbellbacteria bacterium CG10_big_fil_rev_8_21_14_0_10_35_52]|uniref:Serine--tRNA ligase n=1 Tax=Candidatus Campbellbacteria bacterium CG10_big_fil_rev_8_21_14_0_10_35_52 TaxID=1974527 RepID=A0A2M6WV35_9BACT|nr:MAG: serine--tRNA ligase [Candidatus Campbellbacteria bacterium CG10_big_fil_rev_8_21_14_0_10_35_52]